MNVTGPIPQELWSLVYISNLYAAQPFPFAFAFAFALEVVRSFTLSLF